MTHATRTLATLLATSTTALLLATPHTHAHEYSMRDPSILDITITPDETNTCFDISFIIDQPDYNLSVFDWGWTLSHHGSRPEDTKLTMGLYRAHATANGRNDAIQLGYNNYQRLAADFTRLPRLLHLIHKTERDTYGNVADLVQEDLQDCPPATHSYRYVGYMIIHQKAGTYEDISDATEHEHLVSNTTDIFTLPKPPLPSTSALTPNFYTHTSTADRILFTYYVYQFADTLKTHKQLRTTLLGALFPNATDQELLDAIDRDLQWKTPDDE